MRPTRLCSLPPSAHSQQCIAISPRGGRYTCRYFVAVAHIYHFLRRSEVLLYVNGQLVEQQYLIYPKIDVPATSSSASFFVFFIRVLCP